MHIILTVIMHTLIPIIVVMLIIVVDAYFVHIIIVMMHTILHTLVIMHMIVMMHIDFSYCCDAYDYAYYCRYASDC